ncbi:MAG: histidine kinase [Candidatus Kapabacteria bacterium]|jgi:hypothetical protein|nr:histidine kinase [Candidatus Kapabacteria bacterium]
MPKMPNQPQKPIQPAYSIRNTSFRIIALYALLAGTLLSLTVLQLAFETPPHRVEPMPIFESVRFWDSIVFWMLNMSILFVSLWANTRWYEKPLRMRVVSNMGLYVCCAALAILLHYPLWQRMGMPSLGFFLRDEVVRDAAMFAVSLVTARFLAISSEHRHTKEEIALLRQAQLLGQVESLKQQLQPHFFFNSLNTLSGLAREDADKTIEFIEKLSQVFRTVLEIQQKNMVSLKEELDFAKAYLYLLEVRFEGKLQCTISSEGFGEGFAEGFAGSMFFLPSLSSQLLLENVVKHNRMTRQHPVYVKIFLESPSQEQAYFVMENTYKPQQNSSGTRMGLLNLSRRSEILTGEAIVIEQEKDAQEQEIFRVKVPMSKGRKPFVEHYREENTP